MPDNPFAASSLDEPIVDRPGTQTLTLRYIHPLRAATLGAAISAGTMGVLALMYGVVIMGFSAVAGEMELLAVGAVVLVGAPLIYGVIGFISALIAAVVYNLLSGAGLGLRLDFE